MLLDRSGRVIASSDPSFAPLLADDPGTDSVELPLLSGLEDPVSRALSDGLGRDIAAGKSELVHCRPYLAGVGIVLAGTGWWVDLFGDDPAA